MRRLWKNVLLKMREELELNNESYFIDGYTMTKQGRRAARSYVNQLADLYRKR